MSPTKPKATRGRKPRSANVPEKTSTVQVQSLTRAFTLLERLAISHSGLTLDEASGSLGLAKSTTYRLLSSMKHLGFVEYDETLTLWYVGVNAFSVGNAYLKRRDFITQARPFMQQLVAATGETANLAILDGDNIVFVAQVECTEVMRMVVQIGSRGTLHATAVGKSMLAALPTEEAAARFSRTGMQRFTDKTIITPSALAAELTTITERGYSIDDEEQTMGLRCIGANIYNENAHMLAAVSISGPTVRVRNEVVPRLSAEVMKTADQITHTIGGTKPGASLSFTE